MRAAVDLIAEKMHIALLWRIKNLASRINDHDDEGDKYTFIAEGAGTRWISFEATRTFAIGMYIYYTLLVREVSTARESSELARRMLLRLEFYTAMGVDGFAMLPFSFICGWGVRSESSRKICDFCNSLRGLMVLCGNLDFDTYKITNLAFQSQRVSSFWTSCVEWLSRVY